MADARAALDSRFTPQLVVSRGGAHSLIEHRAAIEGSLSATPVNPLQFSIGLENANELLDDLRQALSS